MQNIEKIPFWSWFWVTGAGLIIGVIVTTILAMIIQNPSLSEKANGVIGMGLAIGWLQSLVLRKKHDIGTRWIWVSTVSIIISCWVVDQLEYFFNWEFDDKSIIIGIKMSIGFVGMGVGQALLLKKLGYKDWYIFSLSTLAPFLTVVSIGVVMVTFKAFFVPGEIVLGFMAAIGMIVSYSFFSAFAFRYIQEHNAFVEQTDSYSFDVILHDKNNDEQSTARPIEIIPLWRWLRATVLGFLIGIFVVSATLRYADLLHYNMFEYSKIIIPAFVAYMQYRVLSEVHKLNKRWIWAGVLSFQLTSLIMLVVEIFINFDSRYNDIILALRVCVGSVIMGTYHATILKKLKYTHTYVYPIGYSIAFVISLILVAVLAFINEYYALPVVFMNVPSFIIVVCSYAACTSFAFIYIQKQTFKDVIMPEDKWSKWRKELEEKEQNQ